MSGSSLCNKKYTQVTSRCFIQSEVTELNSRKTTKRNSILFLLFARRTVVWRKKSAQWHAPKGRVKSGSVAIPAKIGKIPAPLISPELTNMPSPEHCFTRFTADISQVELPTQFTFPFYYTPHPLSVLAAKQLQQYLLKQNDFCHDFGLNGTTEGRGKMFGVLFEVKTSLNIIGIIV